MSSTTALRRAERIEDVAIALVFSVMAMLAMSHFLGAGKPPTRLELWIIGHLRFAWKFLIALLKCGPALVTIGLVGGAFLRHDVMAAAVAAVVVALAGSALFLEWDGEAAIMWLQMGIVFGIALLVGARLRRRLAGPRPGLPLDDGARWSVMVIDLLLVPLGVLAVMFEYVQLTATEAHSWLPVAVSAGLTLVLLALRWRQAMRSPEPSVQPLAIQQPRH